MSEAKARKTFAEFRSNGRASWPEASLFPVRPDLGPNGEKAALYAPISDLASNDDARDQSEAQPAPDPAEDGVLAVRLWVLVAGLVVLAAAMAFGLVKSLSLSLAGPLEKPLAKSALAPEISPFREIGREAGFWPLFDERASFFPITEAKAALKRDSLSSADAKVLRLKASLAKEDLPAIIGDRPLGLGDPRFLAISGEGGRELFAETTIDPDLQTQANGWLKLTKARRAALVVLNPFDGQVLVVAGTRDDGGTANPALSETYPAASLFKIITAAGAMEKADYKADSKLAYDGGKHTLYKANVAKKPDQGQRATTLLEGFAESNNAVFGKLGAYGLGAGNLAELANRFYFNRPLGFEAPVAVSSFSAEAGDDAYRLAELASGFNRDTRITPLHAAILAGIAANSGLFVEPAFCREIFDRENNVYYQAKSSPVSRVIEASTALGLTELMEAAVARGTGRRRFADALDHPLLSGLSIGGKTGTINDEDGSRVEWFAAYAYWPEPGSGPVWPLAMAAAVASDGKARLDSQELIRRAIIAYYQPLLDGTKRVYR